MSEGRHRPWLEEAEARSQAGSVAHNSADGRWVADAVARNTHPATNRVCARCGCDRTYISDCERCGGCGCYAPLCYKPMTGCFVATVKDAKTKHDPPSAADLVDRWLGVTFVGGDFKMYSRATLDALARASERMRKMEANLDCKCKKCKNCRKNEV